MRRLRYHVAASLDGYIAGPDGEFDWIPRDPDIDFGALFNEFDTFLMGRKTYEIVVASGMSFPWAETYVFSRTLKQRDHPKVKIVADQPEELIEGLKSKRGKDIWLFGGGDLFRSLAEVKLVDSVEIAIVPVLLGGGLPLLPPPANRIPLAFEKQALFEKSGIVWLTYRVKS